MIKVERFIVGEIGANCYFVSDNEMQVSFLVDTGDYSRKVIERVKEFGEDKLKYILLTHGHFDHIGYASQMREMFPSAKIVIGKYDAHFTNEDDLNLAYHFGLTQEHFDADILVDEGSELDFGTEKIKVISTPGHTKGGVCYILGDSIFTGDTLFKGSIGRTDFPTGNIKEMKKSIERLKALDGDYKIYCGHDDVTTLDFERKNNMYMREDMYDYLY